MKATLPLLLFVSAFGLAAVLAGCATAVSPTPAADRTGFSHVDAVIEAGLSGDAQALRDLIRLSPFPCTTREGLGGPPKCLPDEPDGTIVEALPVLGSEGGHVRKADLDTWQGIGPAELYAVYRTGSDTFSDEFYPAGEFAVVFALADYAGDTVTLHVTQDGIVRIDHGFGPTAEELYQQQQEDFILGPFPPPRQ